MHCSRSVLVHHALPVGHGQVPDQAVAAQHRRHHLEAGGPDRRRPEDEGQRLQQSEGQPAESGEEADVSRTHTHRREHRWSKRLILFVVGCSGSLLIRNLADLVRKEHFILDSEYLTTLLVIVPK